MNLFSTGSRKRRSWVWKDSEDVHGDSQARQLKARELWQIGRTDAGAIVARGIVIVIDDQLEGVSVR
jgi:hypothetical protein